MNRERATFWSQPLGFKQSAALAGGLAAVGFLLEAATGGRGLAAAAWPASGGLLACFVVWLGILALGFRGHALAGWLAGAPTALCAMGGLGLLAVFAGILPQEDAADAWRILGLSHIIHSWPFVLMLMLVLTNLGLAVFKRLFPFRPGSAVYLLNHFGLWLALACGFFGAGDVEKVRFILRKGETTSTAFDAFGRRREMPFALRLDDFSIEAIPPAKIKYVSQVTVFRKNAGEVKAAIEVNRPLTIAGWKLFQSGYDWRMGAASETSILEAVRDPWLPGVYAGIYLMLGGAAMLLWQGTRKMRNPQIADADQPF